MHAEILNMAIFVLYGVHCASAGNNSFLAVIAPPRALCLSPAEQSFLSAETSRQAFPLPGASDA
jgi:hypothetical protein